MAARPGDAQAARPAAAQAMKRGFAAPGAERLIFEPSSQSTLLAEHDLFRKPASTFRDHALFHQVEERTRGRPRSVVGVLGVLDRGRRANVKATRQRAHDRATALTNGCKFSQANTLGGRL